VPKVIETLREKNVTSYNLVDISPELLYLARTRLQGDFPSLSFQAHILDVTDPIIIELASALRMGNQIPLLILLVGNGAILSDDRVLRNIKAAMSRDDCLLVTVESYDSSREVQILNQYKLNEILTLFSRPLHILGIQEDADNERYYELEYDSKESRVKAYFKLKKWLQDHGLHIQKFGGFDERLQVFSSWRPCKDGLIKRLESNGFDLDAEIVQEHNCLGALVKLSGARSGAGRGRV
jgi:hypothetical protein